MFFHVMNLYGIVQSSIPYRKKKYTDTYWVMKARTTRFCPVLGELSLMGTFSLYDRSFSWCQTKGLTCENRLKILEEIFNVYGQRIQEILCHSGNYVATKLCTSYESNYPPISVKIVGSLEKAFHFSRP